MKKFQNRYFAYILSIGIAIFFLFFIFLKEIHVAIAPQGFKKEAEIPKNSALVIPQTLQENDSGATLSGATQETLSGGMISSSIFDISSSGSKNMEGTKFIGDYDVSSDDSITKFVDNKVGYFNIAYVPEDLSHITGQYVEDSKGNTQFLRAIAKENLDTLAGDFYAHFQTKFVVVSAYRSYEYQKGIKQRGCSDHFCAHPGFSEHQSGLAFDMFSASSVGDWQNNATLMRYFEWMKENAHFYGFTNTYQKGVLIDGYAIEPWHWRYVGVSLATYLHDNNLTLAEFYNTSYGKKE